MPLAWQVSALPDSPYSPGRMGREMLSCGPSSALQMRTGDILLALSLKKRVFLLGISGKMQ